MRLGNARLVVSRPPTQDVLEVCVIYLYDRARQHLRMHKPCLQAMMVSVDDWLRQRFFKTLGGKLRQVAGASCDLSMHPPPGIVMCYNHCNADAILGNSVGANGYCSGPVELAPGTTQWGNPNH